MIYDYTFWIVLISCVILSMASAAIGLLIVLQKESLVGDALSHAALPGVVAAFLITQQRSQFFLLLGAFISGVIAIFLITLIKTYTKLSFDGILAVILSGFFGLGMLLLTHAQKMPNAAQAGLKTFIFGQASGILYNDAIAITIVAVVVLVLFLLFYKELKVFVFDAGFARSIGIGQGPMQFLISFMAVMVIIMQLQTVGAILASSMLIAPGIAALQWSRKFGPTILIAVLFGALASAIGTYISAVVPRIPTGASITVIMTAVALLSLLFGRYGMIVQKIKLQKAYKKKVTL